MASENRARIQALLARAPGASTRAVARELDVDESTADYHLRRLRGEGRVAPDRQGRELCWFNAGHGLCPVLRRAVPLLRKPEAAALARALAARPRSAADLARETGLPLGAVRWNAALLEQAGLARRSRSGRLALREGAETCVGKALRAEPCDLWGACAVSRALVGPAPEAQRRRIDARATTRIPARGDPPRMADTSKRPQPDRGHERVRDGAEEAGRTPRGREPVRGTEEEGHRISRTMREASGAVQDRDMRQVKEAERKGEVDHAW